MWKQFLEEIKNYNYVVQRNWDFLPEATEEHDDLDIFCHITAYPEIELISRSYEKIDIRYAEDGYYPPEIASELLKGRRMHKNGFWIPSAKAHFLSLYYHDVVHKEGSPYADQLPKLFLEAYPPTRCIDKGVGYYV